jgi:hypothetical protein
MYYILILYIIIIGSFLETLKKMQMELLLKKLKLKLSFKFENWKINKLENFQMDKSFYFEKIFRFIFF